ncbi:MAG: glucokinase [Acidobacteriota bacterium]|nr:glucokinase [Acidobacteriota bacterium]
MSGLLLAGDVGGTKTNLGLFEISGTADPADIRSRGPRLLRSAHYPSPDFPGLAPIVATFLGAAFLGGPGGDVPPVGAACFGVAGPVAGNRSRLPNLDWPELDGGALAQAIGIPAGRLRLINDLVATAEAIPLFAPDDLAVLQKGNPGRSGEMEGNRALIAAGTGLGMAFLPRIGEAWVPIASEGGHMDFAARNAEEAALAAALRARYGHVSVERVVSGAGLRDVHQHLLESGGEEEAPEVAARLRAAEDPAPVITAAALAGESALSARALDLFTAAYGAAAGNLALAGTATGGVYLGGGIAPKILAKLQEGTFLAAFNDKGRFREYLEAIPVRVVLNDRAALLGAANVAARLLTSG